MDTSMRSNLNWQCNYQPYRDTLRSSLWMTFMWPVCSEIDLTIQSLRFDWCQDSTMPLQSKNGHWIVPSWGWPITLSFRTWPTKRVTGHGAWPKKSHASSWSVTWASTNAPAKVNDEQQYLLESLWPLTRSSCDRCAHPWAVVVFWSTWSDLDEPAAFLSDAHVDY